jgi:NhaA family Na+:H+ antiporter
MAMAVPARSRISQRSFIERIRKQVFALEDGDKVDKDILKSDEQHLQVSHICDTAHAASTPLQHWTSSLENPISIFILPLFALFNAGVYLSSDALTLAVSSPVALGIVAGLVIGKPLGIMLFSLAALRLNAGAMPTGMRFVELIGAGILAGIGFTMSLFITTLGFEGHPELMEPAKIGIIIASVLSATLGTAWLLLTRQK